MDVTELLEQAIQATASDVYFIPDEADYQVKFHIKGHGETKHYVPYEVAHVIISSIKYRAKMNISERRRPQLGQFPIVYSEETVWVRVSSVGDFLSRETVVLRFIYPQISNQHWLAPEQYEQLELHLPESGLFLFSGPTGSGKTTTMYRLLTCLSLEKTVLTIEDPVEIQQSNFVQLQVNETAGMYYDDLIKVALRHRPEVLLIGEIRDKETAEAATKAALSGHLVVSTIHALSARDVMTRLLDLGVQKEQLKAALCGVAYQRLIPLVSGDQAALIDLLVQERLECVLNERQISKFSEEWGSVLDATYKQGKISEKTWQIYRAL